MTHISIQTRPIREAKTVSKIIDWSDSSDRKWLINHLHHCMLNEKVVTLVPLIHSDIHPDSN